MNSSSDNSSKRKGILYGIGVGPGAPDLMTVSAADHIRSADILCLPQAPKEKCRAYQIALQAVPEIRNKVVICFEFPMTRDIAVLEHEHMLIYQKIRDLLLGGKAVAFLTIGDPCIYSTFTYISDKASSEDFPVRIISGVTSFLAAAGRLGISLCRENEELHVGTGSGDLESLLALRGTKVIMKNGSSMRKVKAILRKAEQETNVLVYAVSDCGLGSEKIYQGADSLPEDKNYMTIIFVLEKPMVN